MEHSSIDAHELVAMLPDYWDSLQTITGTGRAIVSEPGNSDRVTLQFQSSREASLIEVRTSVGIEGGQILVDADSLLIYNRVDKYAEKVSVYQSNLTSVGSIASLNMLDLFNFTFSEEEVDRIFEDQRYYMAILSDSSRVTISKEDGWIVEVVQMSGLHDAAYSKIEYEGYSQIENFYLPRRITIFSSDGNSRATFLVQQLEVNRSLPPLRIDLPDDIPIYRPG